MAKNVAATARITVAVKGKRIARESAICISKATSAYVPFETSNRQGDDSRFHLRFGASRVTSAFGRAADRSRRCYSFVVDGRSDRRLRDSSTAVRGRRSVRLRRDHQRPEARALPDLGCDLPLRKFTTGRPVTATHREVARANGLRSPLGEQR